ncbi:MAG TPA: cyclic nucleotide-binding domain-containing protein [Leptospiraceae bacterium]|nr:cyclic nucleotide-binding domain-containing protein [Leptospirales bacterium]HMX55430.1 cyclic nucleotide-binding domain-containing protein [Leptospiraceae bacterium]HMY45732.1 cyclic nucleotide-binding domain-containing protein [Leptospiraceae bacterium]HMZ35873.1 cyclic nucleotide-binding domain-containing protein [Leptospiraceae bacterium]HNE22597.1 cyclic nucleotide-binding domain-containing protein [Leptospiraceae bacterium]
MRNIAVLSDDADLNAKIASSCNSFGDEFQAVFFHEERAFVQYLNYELPEIDIIDFSGSKASAGRAFTEIKDDPWLHFGGSIIIYEKQKEEDLLNRLRGVNIIAHIQKSKVELYLPRALNVLSQHRSILFQRDLHALLQSNISGMFVLDNDPFDVTTYSNLIANFLYNSNLINLDQKSNCSAALVELLYNAIEHGNCCIGFEEKKVWLENGGDILDLIRQKAMKPEILAKKIFLNYRITPERSYFTVRDEGEGFDWGSRLAEDNPAEALHGRGIMIARNYLQNVHYNEKGNEVSFQIEHLHESNVIPRVFADQEEVTVQDGEVIFRQGETSSHLYYIISGKYDIIANGRKVSTLTPADIFLGEMSFLLNNKRSATVIAVGRGQLMKISKQAFINAIREHPHYGIFLARLLAQRLDQVHEVGL